MSRNFEEYRAGVLDRLSVDYTVEDLRNFERWRLKVLEGLSAIYEGDTMKEKIIEAVDDWLDDHPEATTTVEDGAIATAKLASSAVTTEKIADGAVTDAKLASNGIKAEVADLKSDLQDEAVLGKRIVINSLDDENITIRNGIVDYDNTWWKQNTTTYKHAVIPIRGNRSTISIKASEDHNSYVMAVTELTTPASGAIQNVSQYWIRRIEVYAGATFEAIIPPDVKYIYMNTLYNSIDCIESFEVVDIDINEGVGGEQLKNQLIPIRASAHNVRDFNIDGGVGDGCPDDLVDTNLPLWKALESGWANADFIAIAEWYQYFDKSGTINAYDEIFKQFYPYKNAIPRNNPTKMLMSKYPCLISSLNDVSQVKYAMPMINCFINGKKVAVVNWLMSNTDTVAERQTSYARAVVALSYYDVVIVMGDFNTEQGLTELSTWTDAGYTLGNGGYWGTINTYEDTTPNDNIVTKGVIFENFEKGEKITSDHSAVRAKLSLII